MKRRCVLAAGSGFTPWALLLMVLLGLGVAGCSKGTEASQSSPAQGSSLNRVAVDPLGALALAQGKVVVADFGRNSCPSCVEMGRILDRVEPGVTDTVIVRKINVDQEPALIRKYRVRLIPTVMIFDPVGRLVLRHEGVLEERDLLRVIGKASLGIG